MLYYLIIFVLLSSTTKANHEMNEINANYNAVFIKEVLTTLYQMIILTLSLHTKLKEKLKFHSTARARELVKHNNHRPHKIRSAVT